MRTSILSKMTQTYSLIALDIDGTLRGDTLEPSDFVLETLDKCYQRGALIVAATGRSRLSAYQYLDHFPMVDYVVSFQGAMVSSRASSTSQFGVLMPSWTHAAVTIGLRKLCGAIRIC